MPLAFWCLNKRWVYKQPGVERALSNEAIEPWEDHRRWAGNQGGNIHSQIQKHKIATSNSKRESGELQPLVKSLEILGDKASHGVKNRISVYQEFSLSIKWKRSSRNLEDLGLSRGYTWIVLTKNLNTLFELKSNSLRDRKCLPLFLIHKLYPNE